MTRCCTVLQCVRPSSHTSLKSTAATHLVHLLQIGRLLRKGANRCIATPTWLPLTTLQNRTLLSTGGKLIQVSLLLIIHDGSVILLRRCRYHNELSQRCACVSVSLGASVHFWSGETFKAVVSRSLDNTQPSHAQLLSICDLARTYPFTSRPFSSITYSNCSLITGRYWRQRILAISALEAFDLTLIDRNVDADVYGPTTSAHLRLKLQPYMTTTVDSDTTATTTTNR